MAPRRNPPSGSSVVAAAAEAAIDYDPGPKPGFVRVHNATTGGTADIPEHQVALHRPKGWEPLTEGSTTDADHHHDPSQED